MTSGRLYCYGSMMYTCCVQTGWNSFYIPGYNIHVNLFNTVVDYNDLGDEIGSEHEFEVLE